MGRRGPTPASQQPYLPPKRSTPKCPPHLRNSASARERWRQIWQDPAARFFTGSTYAAVVRLVELYELVRSLDLTNEEDRKLRPRLEGPIAKLETELALTPFAKNRLGIPLIDPPDTEDDGDGVGEEAPAPPPPPT